MDESARLAPRNPQAPIASFPVWPPGIPDSPAGDSGLAANSRPSSPHAYVDRNGKLKSILDTATKLLGTLGQPSVRDLQKYLESLGNDNPVMQHFEMVGTNKMRCGGVSTPPPPPAPRPSWSCASADSTALHRTGSKC